MILSTIQKTNLESFFTIYTINDILEHIFIECNIELFHFFVYTFPEATISSDALFKYLKDINVDDIPFIDKVYEYYENNGQHIQSQIHTSALTELFENACENGECIIAQWIYKNSPDINIDEIFENVFNEVCSSDEIEMALWIVSINPNKYHVYIQHGEIIGYFIRRELNLTREINRNLIKTATQPDHYSTNAAITHNQVGADTHRESCQILRQLGQELNKIFLICRLKKIICRSTHTQPS
jgi:hypothetical protein